MSDRCIFCDARDDTILYRGNDGTVILDDPIRTGHLLVGGPRHIAGLHQISETEAGALFSLAQRVSKQIVEQTGASKVYVAAVGDKDPHFHIHLFPKFVVDGNLGPYIFGASGWAGNLAAVDTPDPTSFYALLRSRLAD